MSTDHEAIVQTQQATARLCQAVDQLADGLADVSARLDELEGRGSPVAGLARKARDRERRAQEVPA